MKTTIDLPDNLLILAKQIAVQRRTTLKDIVTTSLRREINRANIPEVFSPESPFEIGALGLPVLKKTGRKLTSEMVRAAVEGADEEDFRTALRFAEGK